MASSIPTNVQVSNIGSAGSGQMDVSWNKSITNEFSTLQAGSFTGALWGYWPGGGGGHIDIKGTASNPTPDCVTTMESSGFLNRKVAIVKQYFFFNGNTSIGSSTDLYKFCQGGTLSTGYKSTGGRYLYLNIEAALNGSLNTSLWNAGTVPTSAPTPAGNMSDFGGSGSNNVWTYQQLGQMDVNGTKLTGTGWNVCDPLLDDLAGKIKAWGGPVFFSFDHEIDNTLWNGSGSNIRRAAALRETPVATTSGGKTTYTNSTSPHWNEYANCFRYIRDRFVRVNGCTNVIFMLTLSGFRGATSSIFPISTTSNGGLGGIYPGNAWVDWIGWDPYDHNGSAAVDVSMIPNAYAGVSTTGPTTNSFYHQLAINAWDSSGSGTVAKPYYLGEYGSSYFGGTRAKNFFGTNGANHQNALQKYPNVKMWLYYGSGSWGDLHQGASTAPWDTASINNLAASLNNTSTTYTFLPAIGTAVTGYKIYIDGVYSGTTLSGNPANPTIHLTGVSSGPHTLQVSSIDNASHESGLSTAVNFTMTGGTQPPAPAITVTAATAYPQATVTWTNPGPGGTRLYQSADGGVTWVLVQQLAAGVTNTTTTGLVSGTTYQFKMNALDATGQIQSVDSNTVSFTASINILPVLSLNDSIVTNNQLNNITLTWTLQSDPSRANVLIYTVDPTQPQNASTPPVAALVPTATSWTDIGEPDATTITYYVLCTTATGQQSTVSSITVNTPNPGGLDAILVVTPNKIILDANNDPVSFTMDASQSVGTNLTYNFHVDDGLPDITTTNPIQTRGNITTQGFYTVTLTVTDNLGNKDVDVQRVEVDPNTGLTTPYLNLSRIMKNAKFGPYGDPNAAAFWNAQDNDKVTLDNFASVIGGGGIAVGAMPQSGDYVYSDLAVNTGNQALGSGFNKVQHWSRIKIPAGATLNSIGTNCIVAGVGGTTTAVCSLYADNGTGKYPVGAPLATSATINLTATGWLQDSTFSYTDTNSVLYAIYWVAILLTLSPVPTTYPTLTSITSGIMLPNSTAGSLGVRGYSMASLSSPPTLSSIPGTTSNPILVGVSLA